MLITITILALFLHICDFCDSIWPLIYPDINPDYFVLLLIGGPLSGKFHILFTQFFFISCAVQIFKVLYPALSAILESNPFSEDDGSNERISMETLLSIFQTTLNFLLDCSVHPQILSQLISYLFFFTNTSLMNTLMTAGK